MKVSTENDNNFGYEKNYGCGRQYAFKRHNNLLFLAEIMEKDFGQKVTS